MKMCLILSAAFVLTLLSPKTGAQTWDGGGTNDNFNTANNWNPNVVPVNNGTANLIFDGTVRPSPDVNLNFNVNSITFAPAAFLFDLQRANNAVLTIQGGGITNNSATEVDLFVPVNFGTSSSINATGAGFDFNEAVGLGTSAVSVGGAFNVEFGGGVSGTGSLTKNGNGELSFALTNTHQYNLVVNAGTVTYVPPATFDANSSILLNGGTLNASSNLVLRGAPFTRGNAATFNLAANRTMTMEEGADVMFEGNYTTTGASYRLTDSGSTWSSGELTVNGAARFEVLDGADMSVSILRVGVSGQSASMLVDGAGTTFGPTGTFLPLFIGQGAGATGRMTLSNGAIMNSVAFIFLGSGAGTGTLEILSGARLNGGLLSVGGSTTDGTGSLLISGAGSRLSSSVTSTGHKIGAASGSGGTVTVENSGSLFLDGDRLLVDRTGVLNINGGSVRVVSLVNEGTVNFVAGSLELSDQNLEIGGGPLGANLILSPGREVHIASDQTTSVGAGGALVLDGGRLETGNLVNQGGTIDFRRGTLLVSGQAGIAIGSDQPLGSNLTLGIGATLDVQRGDTAIRSDGVLRIDGGTLLTRRLTNDGALLFNSGVARASNEIQNNSGALLALASTVQILSPLTNAVGAQIQLASNSGRIIGSGSVNNSGLITGSGIIAVALANNITGEIRAENGKTLSLTGAVAPNAGRINLLGGQIDFAQALTNGPTGQINGRGALNFAGGLTNQGKMQFSGGPTDIFGNVIFTGGASGGELINSGSDNVVSFYGNVVHNGDEIRTSATNTTVFFGKVGGTGPFTGAGAVRFEGTFTPGNSPGSVLAESSVAFGQQSQLILDIAGSRAGLDHDQIRFQDSVHFAGALVIDFIDGFLPRAGETFELLHFDPARASGGFSEVRLARSLPEGLALDATLLGTRGLLTIVPEPTGLGLLLAGLALLARYPSSRRIAFR